MRPEFIPRDKFRAWLKFSELNKLAMFDGILASSYVERAARNGRPFASMDRQCRPIDLVARARAEGHAITPAPENQYEKDRMRATADELRQEIAALEARRAILAAQVSQAELVAELRGHARALTGATLLTEAEIVSQRVRLADCCGVYFLVKGESVIYVGQSVNVHNRIMEHRAGKDFDGFAFVACDESALDILESLYIHVLRPPLNGIQAGAPVAPLRLDKLLRLATRS